MVGCQCSLRDKLNIVRKSNVQCFRDHAGRLGIKLVRFSNKSFDMHYFKSMRCTDYLQNWNQQSENQIGAFFLLRSKTSTAVRLSGALDQPFFHILRWSLGKFKNVGRGIAYCNYYYFLKYFNSSLFPFYFLAYFWYFELFFVSFSVIIL